MAPRAVLFDLGNTLVDYYTRAEFPAVLRVCLQRASVAAYGAGRDEVSEDLFRAALALNREAPDLAVRPLADRLSRLFPECPAIPGCMQEVSRAFLQPIFERARLNPAAHDCLDELRRRDLKTAIVSNTPWGSPADPWLEELERHDLLRRVDAVVFCVQVGWRKPHAAPFQQALKALGIAAAEALFVGDDPRWDVEGARHAGLRPVICATDTRPEASECEVVHSLGDIVSLVAENRGPSLG